MAFCGVPKDLSDQEKVTLEWDGMAGEWDDLAVGYATALHTLLVSKDVIPPNDTVPATTTTRIVDFGCGTGLLTERLLLSKDNGDGATTTPHSRRRVLAVDASTKMIAVLKDKVRSREWDDSVEYVATVLGGSRDVPSVISDWEGLADVVVASSVLSFVPKADQDATMSAIGRLLKPGVGVFCHSDWPQSEQHPNGMDQELASRLYAAGGLNVESTELVNLDMGGGNDPVQVFFGIARKE